MAKKKDADEAVKQETKKQENEKEKDKKAGKADGELDSLKEENERLKEEAGKLKETAQRIQAEFDNYRRRSLADNEQCKVKAAAGVISAILPALDSIDEAVKLYSADESSKELLEGFEKVQKQIMDSLGSIGLNAMECEGSEFDPNLHEAVLMQECEGTDSGIIINVFRKGYTYKDAVIRHAQVIVSK